LINIAGRLRVLGGGPDLPDVAAASGLAEPSAAASPPPFLVVGYDVLGGRLAVNGRGLVGDLVRSASFRRTP